MATVKNTMDLIEKGIECLDHNYNMTAKNARDIIKASNGSDFEIAYKSFFFGYMQGVKATKSETKRKGMKI